MILDQVLTDGIEILNPCKCVFFANDRLSAHAAVDYSGGGADGVEYARGVDCAEGFGEVGFVEDDGLLGPG